MKNYYVYIHYRNDTNNPFYIGKGCGDRAYVKRRRNKYWNNIVNKHGYTIKIYKNNLTEKEAFKLEKELIEKYKDLCNMTDGGEGSSGFKHSKETINQLSEFRKTVTGWKHKESTKNKISKSHKGKIFSDKHKKNIGIASKGRTHSEETKQRLRNKEGTTIIQYDLSMNKIKEWPTVKGAARELNINSRGIRACITYKNKTCGGFIWLKK